MEKTINVPGLEFDEGSSNDKQKSSTNSTDRASENLNTSEGTNNEVTGGSQNNLNSQVTESGDQTSLTEDQMVLFHSIRL